MKFSALRVLLVEDDISTRTTIRVMLGELGVLSIAEASNGKLALNALEEEADKETDKESQINFIISDWNMPDKSGFEFLREIRTTHPDLPFLMITARADESSVGDAKNAGVTAYIRKPFSLNELESKIRNIFPKIIEE